MKLQVWFKNTSDKVAFFRMADKMSDMQPFAPDKSSKMKKNVLHK